MCHACVWLMGNISQQRYTFVLQCSLNVHGCTCEHSTSGEDKKRKEKVHLVKQTMPQGMGSLHCTRIFCFIVLKQSRLLEQYKITVRFILKRECLSYIRLRVTKASSVIFVLESLHVFSVLLVHV